MTSNIFEQSFDQLLNSVGASPAQPVQQVPAQPVQQAPAQPVQQAPAQPVQQAPAQPVQQAPAQPVQQAAQPVQQASIFDQFTMPTVVADEMKAQADAQPVSNTDAYQVDVDIFGAQDVPPTVAPSNVTQEQTESSTALENTETVEPQAPVEEPAPVKEEPKPKAKAKTKAKAKPKAKAKTKKEETSESVSPLINDDTIKAIEEEIDIIVCNAVQKSLVKYFKAIADKVSDK